MMTDGLFKKILIANRGEIACRVARTAARLGIGTVAVYSEADADALHVSACDEAYLIGPAAAAESYLVAGRIIEVACEAGADAIHPGYGFLSENADFAEACAAAGIAFIGPSPEAIRAMGLKDRAKALMEEAGVPVVPGYHGADQNLDALSAEAGRIGFPVLIKAVAGGGGKGMRLVARQSEFQEALASARREAKAAFGEDRVLIEKYITKPRHIEVQVFGDTLGNVVHLNERDCSLQRRHQKVIEEAPAPGVSPGMRAALGEAAVGAAKAIDYAGAGTVEFIVDVADGIADAPFYFMEMNTRLQVEHPVTELVTGTDLVEWQIRVAAGEKLPLAQGDIRLDGHAIEARLYAEDPANDFLPAGGTLIRFRPPLDDPNIRIETGIAEGDAIPIHYDPMIAKIIARGDDREEAIRHLVAGLKATRIAGAVTNLAFLADAADHPAFAAGDIDTGFIAAHADDLLAPVEATAPDVALAALAVLDGRKRVEEKRNARSPEPCSPWSHQGGWRLNLTYRETLSLSLGGEMYEVVIASDAMTINGAATPTPHFDERHVALDGARVYVMRDALTFDFRLITGSEDEDTGAEGPGGVVAPMPGKILKVLAAPGDAVGQGDALIIMEAMKMEYTLAAPRHGLVGEINVEAGQQVTEGQLMLTVDQNERE